MATTETDVRIRDCATCKTTEHVSVAEEGGKATYFVACDGCKTAGPSAPTRGDAIARWNAFMERKANGKAVLRDRLQRVEEENEQMRKGLKRVRRYLASDAPWHKVLLIVDTLLADLESSNEENG